MIFALKKAIAPFFMPLPMITLVLVIGLLLLWLTRRKTAGKIIITLGVVLLYGVSTNLIPDILIRPLENRYPPLRVHGASTALLQNIAYIVVLGGGHVYNPKLPLTGQIGGEELARLVEGIGLHRHLPDSRLVLTGSAVDDPVPEAEMMAGVAEFLGVAPDEMILDVRSEDTKDEAVDVRRIVGEKPFILVTSAEHMPRAMALFYRQGMQPIPAPTVYQVKTPPDRQQFSPVPKARNIDVTDHAIHEYLGILWAWLRGQISSPAAVIFGPVAVTGR